MTPEDAAAAQTALVERAISQTGSADIRRATVTAISPFTISMNGVSIPSPPKSPHYAPIVGDVVLVLMDGSAPYVLEAISTTGGGGLVYSDAIITSSGPSASTTSRDVTLATFTSPATGWVEIHLSAWFHSTVTAYLTAMIYDNSTNVNPDYPFLGSAAAQTAALAQQSMSGGVFLTHTANTWFPGIPITFAYRTTLGAVQSPTLRIGTSVNSVTYHSGLLTVKVYAD